VGQSLPRRSCGPVIAKSARLQQEIDEVLTQAKKKEEEVTWPTCQALANFAL
jgi:hypothetical protein